MQNLILLQLNYEIESSKRLLNFISDENVHLKHRLAEVAKDNSEITILSEMEDYLNEFVAQDELINLLKNDIAKTEKRLVSKIDDDGEILKDVYASFRLLQSNILKTEELFIILCKDFNNFICEHRIIW